MYEARQNKEKVSRRIDNAGDRVTQRVKVDSGGRLINVIQRQLYDSKEYYKLFDNIAASWRDGNRREFYVPTREKEPHIHAYRNGVVYTAIGHNHSYLVDSFRNINVQSVGTAKDDIRNLIADNQIEADAGYKIIGGLNILLHLNNS
ncbi:hypothetical protein [Phocaeicola barnesiae]